MKRTSATAAVVGLLLILMLPGCATHESGYRITEETVAFIHPGATTRAEVIENLGPPLLNLSNPNVIAYSWGKERATGNISATDRQQAAENRQMGSSIPAASFGGESADLVESRRWAYCIALDDADHVTRTGRVEVQGAGSLERAVREWAGNSK